MISLPAGECSKVYILLVNWNGWADTIECLESIFRLDYRQFRVLVCDNNSQNQSADLIALWAAGKLNVRLSNHNPLKRLSFPPVPKPIEYIQYNRAEAEAGGRRDREEPELIVIQTGANLGFAGGNNVGLRYILARGDFAFVWLLNNDTVVEKEALSALIAKMNDPLVGMCGSTIPYYHNPTQIWALGGATYNRWSGMTKCVGLRQRFNSASPQASKLAYVAGASMFVSQAFVRRIGLMCEDYFLYFEELDWATRARGKFTLSHAPESVVYHKVGASTSQLNTTDALRKATRCDEYMCRSGLLFTRRYFKLATPTVWATMLIIKTAKRFIRSGLKWRFAHQATMEGKSL